MFVCKKLPGQPRETLSANKAILAAGSRKLALFLADTGDEDVTVMVPDSNFSTLRVLLQYLYSGEVFVDSMTEELESLMSEWVL